MGEPLDLVLVPLAALGLAFLKLAGFLDEILRLELEDRLRHELEEEKPSSGAVFGDNLPSDFDVGDANEDREHVDEALDVLRHFIEEVLELVLRVRRQVVRVYRGVHPADIPGIVEIEVARVVLMKVVIVLAGLGPRTVEPVGLELARVHIGVIVHIRCLVILPHDSEVPRFSAGV